jgi:hypothetical protein
MELTSMQNYTTRQLLETALPAAAQHPTSPGTRVQSELLLIAPKMETPTPMSMADREKIDVPIGASNLPNRKLQINMPQAEGNAEREITDEIMHEEPETIPINSAIPGVAEGRRRVPSAGKDEWADSSDDERIICVNGAEHITSEYFQSTRARSNGSLPIKRAKTSIPPRDARYHKMSGPKQPPPKPLSMSSMPLPSLWLCTTLTSLHHQRTRSTTESVSRIKSAIKRKCARSSTTTFSNGSTRREEAHLLVECTRQYIR